MKGYLVKFLFELRSLVANTSIFQSLYHFVKEKKKKKNSTNKLERKVEFADFS